MGLSPAGSSQPRRSGSSIPSRRLAARCWILFRHCMPGPSSIWMTWSRRAKRLTAVLRSELTRRRVHRRGCIRPVPRTLPSRSARRIPVGRGANTRTARAPCGRSLHLCGDIAPPNLESLHHGAMMSRSFEASYFRISPRILPFQRLTNAIVSAARR